MSTFKRLLPIIILCILEAVAGILILTNGEGFFSVLFMIVGIFLLVVGLITLIKSLLAGRKGGSIPGLPMVASLFMIGFGAFFTAASGAVIPFMVAFTMVAGCFMLVNGIFKLIQAFALRGEGVPFGFLIFDAILTILLGIVMAFYPFGATVAKWTIIGVMMIVSAVIDLISMIVLANKLKNTTVTVVEVKAQTVDNGAKETVAAEGKEVQTESTEAPADNKDNQK